jgi:hypothetical protein
MEQTVQVETYRNYKIEIRQNDKGQKFYYIFTTNKPYSSGPFYTIIGASNASHDTVDAWEAMAGFQK